MKNIKIIRYYPLKDGWFRIECDTDHDSLESDLELIDHKVQKVHQIEHVQQTLISGSKTVSNEATIWSSIADAKLDESIVEIEENVIRLTKFLKDKELWTGYNDVFKEHGYKWVADGKHSRWER